MAHVREKPPLRVKMDIQTPGGKHYRWAEDEPSPENVPSGLRWSDTMPGGFETMDCVLPRKPGIDYADLEQFSTIRVLGASGDVAGEFRLERAPRTSGDQVSVSPGAVGWQAHLEDDKSAQPLYVDRDFSHWGEPHLARRLGLLGTSPVYVYDQWSTAVNPSEAGDPAVVQESSRLNSTASLRGLAESWYVSHIVPISDVYYEFEGKNLGNGADTAWVTQATLTSSLTETGTNDLGADHNGANGPVAAYVAATGTRVAAFLQTFYSGTFIGDGQWTAAWKKLAVYGDHGLTGRGTDPVGFYASDIVGHAVPIWAPLLSVTSESVQPSSFVIPHMAFLEPTTAGEVVRQATRFGLQDWGVWDNKTFWWHERGTFSKRWRSRVAPAQLDETGPQVDRLWESIIVQYQDVDGTAKTVGPPGAAVNTQDAALKDNDPDNPANQLGIIRRDILQMGTSTPAGAIEVGRRFLEQAKQLDRSGRARLVGHVEDDKGVLHPYWRPRAGDYIQFLDAADSSYRRIVKTDKDHSARTCGLDLDAPPEGLAALLERLGVVLVPLGVG